MSLGFSVSDIYGCARLAYILYDEFKQALGACQEFSRELLLFHRVLSKSKSTIECESSHLSQSDEAALGACFESCKELLFVQTFDALVVPESVEKIEFVAFHGCLIEHGSRTEYDPRYDQITLVRGLRQHFGERGFALQIPKLQRGHRHKLRK